ncbi:TPA: hypothetical protein DCY43_01935 [candidate division WWE3 bacterium]|uniref:Uncharacterized protein n=2 Tax=Katanobacteria TaxID=422282 RepID=A0A0G1KJ37_UNCKA|nr:MAG: hypothetical protein UW82_C0034G0006 [candidate division WWE3 bacterium GW2011_GWC2_44_9]HAZ29495.1 hypothetical protein [candidate division WWE3 bacterium]
MSDKEHIATLVTSGAALPPINPYLDDSVISSDDDGTTLTKGKKAKAKPGRKPEKPAHIVKESPIVPDPKDYVAELERTDEDDPL